jgi:hypothetical protein
MNNNMKITIILITLTMTISSFTIAPRLDKEEINSSEKLASHVVSALQNNSVSDYVQLFPSLPEFHSLMDKNASVYGRFLPEAKADFSLQYQSELVPEVNEAFREIIEEGKAKGIDWKTIELLSVDNKTPRGFLPSVPVTLRFKSNTGEFSLQLERVLVIGNEFRITQYIRFV